MLKKCMKKEDPPLPYLSLTQAVYLFPSHWLGWGTHSSQLANLKQIVTGRRGKEGGRGRCLRQSRNKLEQPSLTLLEKICVNSLKTTCQFGFFVCLFFQFNPNLTKPSHLCFLRPPAQILIGFCLGSVPVPLKTSFRKLTEHCKPSIIEKIEIYIYIFLRWGSYHHGSVVNKPD